MLKNIRFTVAFVVLFFIAGTVRVKSQDEMGNIYGRPPLPNRTSVDLHNIGIAIVDPVLPESLIRAGITIEEIREKVNDAARSIGWSQNQTSQYFIAVSIVPKAPDSVKAKGVRYIVQADYGCNEMAVNTPAVGMTGDESFWKAVVITDKNYSMLLSTVVDLSRKASMKLREKFFRTPKEVPHSLQDNLY